MREIGNSGDRLEQLTGLRYFAALLVFLSHSDLNGASDIFATISKQGYVGVSFFFILSGFVLSYSYGEKISNGSLGFGKYILIRLARLSPLHLATAAPFVLLAIWKSDLQIMKTLLNVFYLQSWVPNSSYYFSLNAPSWSLSNEMFFYFCFFPLILLSTDKLLRLFGVFLVVVVISSIIVNSMFADKIFWGGSSFAHWLFYIFPGFRLLEFIVGMILYKLWKKNYRLNRFLVLPSYIILICSMCFAEKIPEPFRLSLFFIPFAALFFYVHLSENNIFVSFFSCKALVLLGNSSFAFYLIHQPLIDLLSRILVEFEFEFSKITLLLVSLFSISILSVLVYLFFEKKSEFILRSYIENRTK